MEGSPAPFAAGFSLGHNIEAVTARYDLSAGTLTVDFDRDIGLIYKGTTGGSWIMHRPRYGSADYRRGKDDPVAIWTVGPPNRLNISRTIFFGDSEGPGAVFLDFLAVGGAYVRSADGSELQTQGRIPLDVVP